jgi:hypothetical protein
VKHFKWWAVAGMAALTGLLAACGGSGGSSNGSVSLRLVNATQTHPSIDLLVNSGVALSATAKDNVSVYSAPPAGVATLQINDAGSSTALSTSIPTLTGGQVYTMVAYESAGTVKTVILNESYAAPVTGSVSLHLYDAAPEAGKLDVYITDPTVDLATVTSPTTSFTTTSSLLALTYAPGTYRIRITAFGNKSDLRADIPNVTLTNQQVGTVILTPSTGGVLIDGGFLVQQGLYTASRNTNVRVRLAAAVSGGASVSATAVSPSAGTSTVVTGGSIAPAFGFYTLVPADSSLNVSVNGGSVGAPATPLVAGSDMTLLVYGSPASSTATLLTDDNRPPVDPTTVKLRLINGITGSTGTLTLTANTAPVGNGTAAGQASGYTSVIGSTNAMNLSLTSTAVSGVLYSNTGNILNPGGVYTVMAAGDISAPQLLIR